jgi:hypothetical protein
MIAGHQRAFHGRGRNHEGLGDRAGREDQDDEIEDPFSDRDGSHIR